jgi:hypothetical protein
MPDEFENPFIDASNEAFIQSLGGGRRRSPGDLTLLSGPKIGVRLVGLLYLGIMLRRFSLSRVGDLADGIVLKQIWALRL